MDSFGFNDCAVGVCDATGGFMTRTLSIDYGGQTYIWDGHTWCSARDYTIPHQALINTLDQLSADAKRALAEHIALDGLKAHVDDLLRANAGGNAVAIREALLQLYDVVEDLRRRHSSKPFSEVTVACIRQEQDRSGLKFPPGGDKEYRSICWRCSQRGKGMRVDKRIDAECGFCKWAICPVCGACRDPKHGDCPENPKRLKTKGNVVVKT
jgi:hypothetical protein